MGRYYFSKKQEADNLKKIDIYWMRKKGLLSGWVSSTIIWTNKSTGNKSSVGITVSTKDRYVRLYFIQTEENGKNRNFDYKMPLTTTPCNYGGERYWFICPLLKNSKHCRRRVGVVYKAGDYFGCRHCYELTYASCNGKIISIREMDRIQGGIRRTHYKGLMTKRYRHFLKKQQMAKIALHGSILVLKKRLDRSKQLIEKHKTGSTVGAPKSCYNTEPSP